MKCHSRSICFARAVTLLIVLLSNASVALSESGQTATLTYPLASSSLSSTQQFWWTPVDGAHGYWLLLHDDEGNAYSSFEILPKGVNNVVLQKLPDVALTAELYTIVLDSEGAQNWDRVSYSHLNASPSTIVEPSGNKLNGAAQLFRWDAVSAADSYYLTIRDANDSVLHGVDHGQNTQVWINGLPTDGGLLTATLYTIVDGNWDRKYTEIYTAATVSSGYIANGFDWTLPAYADHNSHGGLVRSAWGDDIEATEVALVDLLWRDAYDDGRYIFPTLENYLDNFSYGDKVIVRLGVTSRCDLPDEWMYSNTFDFYAGNSIAFWEQSYLSELERFVNAFANEYADDDRVVGVYLGIADGEYRDGDQLIDYCGDYWRGKDGWGEFWMDETELVSAVSAGLISADVFYWATTSIVDIYLDAFGVNRGKLAFMNLGTFTYDNPDVDSEYSNLIEQIQLRMRDLVDYSLSRGVGNRDGQIEFWMRYNQKRYGIKFRAGNDDACYHEIDEGYADWLSGRFSGTENEEYGYGVQNAWIERYGPLSTQPYRFMMSSLRALQMRRNYMTFDTEGFNNVPDSVYDSHRFVDYLTQTLGRTKEDTPDVFVMLGERYLNQHNLDDYDASAGELGNCADGDVVTIREFGRWLSETEGGGVAANQIKLDEFKDTGAIAYSLPLVDGSTKYEYQARRHDSFKLDINDDVVISRCGSWCELEIKIVFYDERVTTLSVKNQFGTLGSVKTTGNGGFKTASFVVSSNFSNNFEGADFAIQTSAGNEPLPVAMVRVNFSQP